MTYNKKNMVTTQQETDFYNYLVNKDYQNNGFFRYGFFKKIMKWYFGVFNEYRYRKIFNNMANTTYNIDIQVQSKSLGQLEAIGYVDWN